jgi:hypothetical protein
MVCTLEGSLIASPLPRRRLLQAAAPATPLDEGVEEQLSALYSELLAGPRNVPLPKPSGPAGAGPSPALAAACCLLPDA